MTNFKLVWAEILHRKLGSMMALTAVLLAVAATVSTVTFFKSFDIRTEKIVVERSAAIEKMAKDNYKKAKQITKKLGFNLMIFPIAQNDLEGQLNGITNYMPEEYVHTLAKSPIVSFRHLMPSLKERVRWPEQKIKQMWLEGLLDEVPVAYRKDKKKAMEPPIPKGKMLIGHLIAESTKLKIGDKVTLMGEEFEIFKIRKEVGDQADATVRIHLHTAQKMLGQEGKINSILALKCGDCAFERIANIRKEVATYLPGTKVVEFETKSLARAEMRDKDLKLMEQMLALEKTNREADRSESSRKTEIALPLIVLVMGLWVAMLFLTNARDRSKEIGIFRALGWKRRKVVNLFLIKAGLLGLFGALLGYALGYLGVGLYEPVALKQLFDAKLLVLVLIVTPFLTIVSAWLPALTAAAQDPAEVLRAE
jgi:putative ABC transport system permease protein